LTGIVNAETSEGSEYYEPVHKYTNGSVSEVFYDVGYDKLTEQFYITLSLDKFGTCVYDDSSTSYIDGIRVNGLTVDSLRLYVDPTVANTIEIKTVYKDDFTGTLAQISDGVYDYANPLKNPVTLLMAGYYALAALFTIASIIVLLKSKKTKVKTSEENAQSIDVHAKSACADLKNEAISIITPVFNTLARSQEAIVKSIILTHSKDPNSHLEALESLRTISGLDINDVLVKVANEIRDSISLETQHKNNALEDLTKIAEAAQGGSDDGNSSNLPIL
jgi:hypothetical protein